MAEKVYNSLIKKETALALVGLGYVGMPISVAFANKGLNVIGYDLNEAKIGLYQSGIDPTNEVGTYPVSSIKTAEAVKIVENSQIILNGRIVKDRMGKFVADASIKQMVGAGLAPKKCHVVILGLTFKGTCPDTRNSKAADIIKRLNEYGIEPTVVDPLGKVAGCHAGVRRDAHRAGGIRYDLLETVNGGEKEAFVYCSLSTGQAI